MESAISRLVINSLWRVSIKGVIKGILKETTKKMRKFSRNFPGITSRMTDLSGVDVARQRLEEVHKMNLSIVKQFEELKLKYNDVISYEALTTKEKDEDQKILFKGLFEIRRKKFMEAIDILRKDAEQRLWFDFA